VGRFAPRPVRFGRRPADEGDEAEGLPTPQHVKLLARRAAGIAEAAETLAQLPAPGESLHCLMTARLDMTDVLNALLGKLGRCETAYVCTLGYNRRNFRMMLEWLDAGTIGSLTLLASIFFRSHNGELWTETVEEFRRRGQRAACCPSHCKVMALAFADGTRFAIEGSANLCSNGSAREQFCIVNDAGLYDFHARWIEELVSRHETHASDSPPAT
jgi:hypothetical protein